MKILISAYACEPDRGSEPAVGWNWVMQSARFHEVWAITRANNRPVISAFMARHPLPNLHWVYYDLPRWSRFWKRRKRGVRLYYLLWQLGAYRLARRLHQKITFDVVHHATFANYWLPTFLVFLPVPFVWGPVGGGESPPRLFYRTFAWQGRVFEHLRDLARQVSNMNPLVRTVASKCDVALATTPETGAILKRLGSRRVRLLSQVALDTLEYSRLSTIPIRRRQPFRIVSVGNLLHLKGFHLGLIAFSEFRKMCPHAEYWVIGDGPERGRLARLARALGSESNIYFLGQISRSGVMEALAECDVLLHPSLHDSGGFVCIEALAAGRPVVCLELGGPAVLVTDKCGFKIPAKDPRDACAGLAAALAALAQNPSLRKQLGEAGRARVQEMFSWDQKGDAMDVFYGLAVRRRRRATDLRQRSHTRALRGRGGSTDPHVTGRPSASE